jgi:hypothetical protein
MHQSNIDFDKKLGKKIFQSCWTCGSFVRTNDKARLALFMLDHWGMDGIKKCKPNPWGRIVNKYYMFRYRNI